MIVPPSGVRVWLSTGVTDMRRGMNGLALQVQQGLGCDPHGGDLYVFRGRRGDLLKILGMTAGAYRSTPSDGSAGGSSGPRRWTGPFPSPPLSLATCWKASTGGTRSTPDGRSAPDNRGLIFPRA